MDMGQERDCRTLARMVGRLTELAQRTQTLYENWFRVSSRVQEFADFLKSLCSRRELSTADVSEGVFQELDVKVFNKKYKFSANSIRYCSSWEGDVQFVPVQAQRHVTQMPVSIGTC